MSTLIEVGVGCALIYVSTTIAPTGTGWEERSEIDVGALEDACDRVMLPLPAGVDLADPWGRELLGDDTRRKIDPISWEILPRALQGDGEVVVHLPDLVQGDRARLRFTRRFERTDPYAWGPTGAGYAELRVEGDGAVAAPTGRVREDGPRLVVRDATPDDAVTVRAPGHEDPWTAPEAGLLPPARPPEVTRQLTLIVPDKDPQLALYPGGGSRVHTRLSLAFEPEERDRGWLVPLHAGHDVPRVLVEPRDDAVRWRERSDGIVLVVASSEGPARVTLEWTAPDAPTYGRAAPGETLDVTAPDGKVVIDRNGAWFLAGIANRPVIPARSALVKALDNRFRGVAIPEPGLPNDLRGQQTSWDLVAQLPDAIGARAQVFDPGAGALWPRKLTRARKTGGLTPTEAALITWLYAHQVEVQADWVLAHDARNGSGGDASPDGYDHVLVRLTLDGETRWMDPGCTACAPFEVRPELLGADAIGKDVERTPEPVPGAWRAGWGDGFARWELDGPAALDLRRWLADIPSAERHDALAARMAGPGAALVESEGLDTPGASIRVAARGSVGVRADPTRLPPADRDGNVWVDWVGRREVHRSAGPADPWRCETEHLTWTRGPEQGAIVERIEIRARLLGAADLACSPPVAGEPEQDPTEAPQEPTADPGPAEHDGGDQGP